jgi:SET domain-containing protein 6
LQEKVEAEEEEELEEYFIIERDSGEPDSEGRLTFQAKLHNVSLELEEQMKAVIKALKKSKPDAISKKRKRDEISGVVIMKALKSKLAQYPTLVEEDETLLTSDGLEKRRRMAIEVRVGEKRILQEALALVKGAEDEERVGKKSRREA